MILPYLTMPSCCNVLPLICLQTLKVKVKILCDVFEKHESPPENGMLKVSLISLCCPLFAKAIFPFLSPEEKKTPLL